MSEADLEGTGTLQPALRVDLLTPVVTAAAGPATVAIEVYNTSKVIETIDVRLLGLMAESVVTHPEEVTLFPAEGLSIAVEMRFHDTLPAGVHEGLLVVTAGSGASVPVELPLTVEVPVAPAASLRVEPPIRTGGSRGTFELLVDNEGNTELDLLVQATDANRVLDLTLATRTLNLRVDQNGYVPLVAHLRRPWFGAPVEHLVTVTALGSDVEEVAEARFRQKAVFTPGVITILTLLVIVLLWAAAMLFGVTRALAPSEPTKAMGASFAQGIGSDDLDPAAVGGSVVGEVTAASTSQPLPRVTVEVFGSDGAIVTATATADDGTYEIDGLLPSRYRLRLRATGFEEQWWPGVPDVAGAGELTVGAVDVSEAGPAELVGLAGSLGGEIIAGDGAPVITSVEVVAVDLVDEAAPAVTSTDDNGLWSIAGLTAPATYRITYAAPGYAPVEMIQEIGGGEQVAVNATRLPAAPGSLSGLVRDGDGVALGGVDVVARRGETELTTTTPTSGEIGTFGFEDLETPGTYLLTFTRDGFASETQGVRLEPGESLEGLEVELTVATGTIRGQATSSGGQALGGVGVSVSGGGTVLGTETLTSGDVGSFRLAGLPLPGVYTVTFDVDGYTRETVQVELARDVPEATASVVMRPSVGRITGQVVDDGGQPISGASVEISDGSSIRTTTTASAPTAQRGRFSVGDLGPGTYTITATAQGGRTLTVLRTLGASSTEDVTLRVVDP